MSVRFADQCQQLRPRVFKDRDAIIFPWVADVPFIPSGDDRILVDRQVFSSWPQALADALQRYPNNRPKNTEP